jgi:hypothetical protein
MIDPTTGKPVIRSLRLSSEVQSAVNVVTSNPDIRSMKDAGIDAAVDATVEEFDIAKLQNIVNEVEDLTKPQSAGKRKTVRGGAMREELVAKLKEYAKATLNYAIAETGPVGASVVNLTRSVGNLAQEAVVRAPVSVAVLSVSGTTFTVNFFASLFEKFNTWARMSGTTLGNMETARAAAAAATADLPSIARTTAVGVVVFNQLGLLPLSAIVAAIVFAFEANVKTGPGRSLLIAQFYTWYISRNPDEQKEILKLARTYTVELGKGAATSPAATNATNALAAKVAGFTPKVSGATGETKSMSTVLSEGAPAAAMIGKGIVDATTQNTTPLTEEPDDTIAKKKGKAAAEQVVAKATTAVGKYPLPPPRQGGRKRKMTRRAPKRRRTQRRVPSNMFAY